MRLADWLHVLVPSSAPCQLVSPPLAHFLSGLPTYDRNNSKRNNTHLHTYAHIRTHTHTHAHTRTHGLSFYLHASAATTPKSGSDLEQIQRTTLSPSAALPHMLSKSVQPGTSHPPRFSGAVHYGHPRPQPHAPRSPVFLERPAEYLRPH